MADMKVLARSAGQVETGGDGAFSVVFKATHITKQIPVALKFLSNGADVYRQLCFQREGDLLNSTLKGDDRFVQLVEAPEKFSLSVSIPGVGSQVLEFPFLALEWMSSGDLGGYCSPVTSHNDLLQRLHLFQGVLGSTWRLYHHNCCHRDLKPTNFLTGRHQVVKLADFGTAKLLVPGSPPLPSNYSAPPGDVRYSAPEMLACIQLPDEFRNSPDLYSVGAILFEMLTGHLLERRSV